MLKILNARAWMNALAQCWAKAPVLSFMLFFGLCAGAAYAIAPERPQSPPPASVALVATSAARASSDALSPATAKLSNEAELSDRIKTLEERERATYMAVLDGQRKSIDWWFSLLGIAVGAMAVMFGALPLLLTRQQKADIEKELAEAKKARNAIESSVDEAKKAAVETKKYRLAAKDSTQQIMEYKKGIIPVTDSKRVHVNGQKNPQKQGLVLPEAQANDDAALCAQAIQAGERLDAELAALLWLRVLDLEPSDARAALNHAYWLQYKFNKLADTSVNAWLSVSEAYARAENLDHGIPKNYLIYNNWGVALDAQAQALFAKHDLDFAQIKWREAGQKFAQALEIKPNLYDAANNWGAALGAEAQTLSRSGDLLAAQTKWREAKERFAQAQDIDPKKHEAVFNWGNVLASEAQALRDKGDLSAAQIKQQEAGEKYALARRIQGHN